MNYVYVDEHAHCACCGKPGLSLCEACYGAPIALPEVPRATPVARKRGRPKVTRAGLPVAITAYSDMRRREREHHRKRLAEIADVSAEWDIKIASLALEPYGIQLIPGPSVVHVYMDSPYGCWRVAGQDWNRKIVHISGSVWDRRKLIWRRPSLKTLWQLPMRPIALKLTNGPKVKCAHRSWKSAAQQLACRRTDDADTRRRSNQIKPRGDDPAAADALLAAIGHLATPATKRAHTFLQEGVNAIKKSRGEDYKPVTLWRPWWQLANPRYWQGKLPCSDRLLIRASGSVTKVAPMALAPWPHLFELRWRGYPGEARQCDTTIPPNARPTQGKLPIPPCTWAFPATEWPWDYIAAPSFDEEAEKEEEKPLKINYRLGKGALKQPNITRDEPFMAAARLWNWRTNYLRRLWLNSEEWPDPFHGECFRVDSPRAFPDDLGGECCRWSGRRSLPKKTCPLQCWRRNRRQSPDDED